MVSIIVPVYNVEKYLQRCLDSCFSQTCKDIEVIAVDDGSTDASGKMLDKYALLEPRLKVVHQHNRGVVYAREVALLESKGDYICFVDSDDYITQDMIHVLLEIALKFNYDIVSCDFYICNEKKEGKVLRENSLIGPEKEDALASILLRKCTWSLCGKLFRRCLFDSVKMPYGLKIGEDGLVCFQAYSNSNKVAAVKTPCYNYIQRSSSVTHVKDRALSLHIIEFMLQIIKMKDKYHWGANTNIPMKTFLASQIYVYYVNGGELNTLIKYLGIPFTIREMIRYELRIIEKIGLFVFFKMNYVSSSLRKLYIYANRY